MTRPTNRPTPNCYRGAMVPDGMRRCTDRLMAAIEPFARVLFVTTGGNCTAVEVRPFDVPEGEHLLITNADAQAPLLDLDGHGPDREIMIGACHDDVEWEYDDSIILHRDCDDTDTAIAMVARVVLSWLSAREMVERLRTVAAETLAVPTSIRYVPTLNGVALWVTHPVAGSTMVIYPPTAWRMSTCDGGEHVAESSDPADIVGAIGEWLSV